MTKPKMPGWTVESLHQDYRQCLREGAVLYDSETDHQRLRVIENPYVCLGIEALLFIHNTHHPVHSDGVMQGRWAGDKALGHELAGAQQALRDERRHLGSSVHHLRFV